LINSIQEFNITFDKYFKAWTEYLNGGIFKDRYIEYQFNHPTLFELSNELQVKFYKLPKLLRNRLLDIEFEIFLHCNNLIDFYSFRSFIIEKRRFERLATIAVRVDSEIRMAQLFIENNIWEEYSDLPKRRFDFYREDLKYVPLMDELCVEKKEEIEKIQNESNNNDLMLNNVGVDIQQEIVNNKKEKGFFVNLTEYLGTGEKITGFANGTIENLVKIVSYFKN